MQYLGDYNEDDTLYFIWSTNDSSGASITRATDGTVSVYKDNGTTQSVAGITDTEDFDSLTGIHACTIDLSADAFYATGADYSVVLSGATIDGQTVNAVLAHFSIENRYTNVVDVAGTAQTAGDLAALITTVDTVVDGIQTDLDNATDGLGAIKTETAAILADTAEIGTAGAGLTDLGGMSTGMKAEIEAEVDDALGAGGADLTAIPWNSAWDAEVESEVNDALVALGLDHLVSTSVTGTDVADNSIIADLVSKSATSDYDDYVNTTDSLQAIRDKQTDIETDTAEIGAAGAGLTGVPWNASWDAEVQSEVNDGLVALGLDHLVSASVAGADITDDSIVAQLVSKSGTADWDDFDNTTDSLQALQESGVTVDISEADAQQIADTLLMRALDDAEASGVTDNEKIRSLMGAIRKLVNLVKLSADRTTLQVHEEDDATVAYEQAVTTSPGADPINRVGGATSA